ncbi:MAG: hypothetical protein WCD20_09120 [Rhodomicrobium sp.]
MSFFAGSVLTIFSSLLRQFVQAVSLRLLSVEHLGHFTERSDSGFLGLTLKANNPKILTIKKMKAAISTSMIFHK